MSVPSKSRAQRPWLVVFTLVAVVAVLVFRQLSAPHAPADAPVETAAPASEPAAASGAAARTEARTEPAAGEREGSGIGFRSRDRWQDHWQKHGREFADLGIRDAEAYLAAAQALRDVPAGGDVLEERRADGVTTRFDRQTGAFLAFNRDRTIRTFFRPNDGEAYFHRQANREH